jgi:hypothetical protein
METQKSFVNAENLLPGEKKTQLHQRFRAAWKVTLNFMQIARFSAL